jgi:hypothetical protein
VRVVVVALAFALAGTALAAVPPGTPRADRIDAVNGARDVIRCGAGRDIVVADQKDVVGRDCETVTRRIALDSTTNPAGQHRSIVEPSAAADGNSVVAVFQSGRIIDGGAAAIGWATSSDGGLTFRHGLLPESGAARVSDPAVARDRSHGLWLAAVLAIFPTETRLLVYASPDGIVWSPPVVVAAAAPPAREPIAFDKEWIACDNGPTSPNAGSCYLAYTDLTAGTGGVQATRDGGATWGPATQFGPQGGDSLVGAVPAVTGDGAVVVVYATGDLGAIDAVSSSDGGTTFGPPVRIAPIASHPTQLRVPPLPSVAQTAHGVSVVWPDCSARPGCTSNDIVVSNSTDGTTWSPPKAIGGTGDYLTPAIGAGAGSAAVLAYARLPGPCCKLGIRLFRSADDGVTWGPPSRLDAQPMDAAWLARSLDGIDTVGFLGDYMAVAFVGSRPVPVFAAAHAPQAGALRQDLYATTRLP